MKRRTFLKQTATAAAGATLLPACNIRRSGSAFSLNNLNVACVGTGRMGNAAAVNDWIKEPVRDGWAYGEGLWD